MTDGSAGCPSTGAIAEVQPEGVQNGAGTELAGADEFARSIDEQREQVAAFAKELGIAELPQD